MKKPARFSSDVWWGETWNLWNGGRGFRFTETPMQAYSSGGPLNKVGLVAEPAAVELV